MQADDIPTTITRVVTKQILDDEAVERARVYTPTGRMAHLLRPLDSPNSTVRALCGRWPGFENFWLGTGSQRECEEAARRPLCTQCEQRAMNPTLIREI